MTIDGQLVSQPYVQMTTRRDAGVRRRYGRLQRLHDSKFPRHRHTRLAGYAIEPDASAASYFWAAAAITGGEVTVEGLSAASLQGDVAFVDCLEQMGCEVAP